MRHGVDKYISPEYIHISWPQSFPNIWLPLTLSLPVYWHTNIFLVGGGRIGTTSGRKLRRTNIFLVGAHKYIFGGSTEIYFLWEVGGLGQQVGGSLGAARKWNCGEWAGVNGVARNTIFQLCVNCILYSPFGFLYFMHHTFI